MEGILEKLELVLVSAGNDYKILNQKLFEKWREIKREEIKLVRGKYYKIYQSGTYTWVSLSDPYGMAELLFWSESVKPKYANISKYTNILSDALEFLPEKVAEIMDEIDIVIQKTTDESIVKQLFYVWNELDSLKTQLVNCSKFFKYFFKGDQQ